MRRGGSRRQRGSVLVMAAFGLAVAIGCLAVLDVAHIFTVRRDLQKVADLAALAGARLSTDCATMQARGRTNANANAHATGADRGLALDCGTWSAASGFVATAATPSSPAASNALRVTATRHVPYFFMSGTGYEVQAQAIARNQPQDVFSLGTGLARVHDGALNALLSATLGKPVNLDLASWQGLASTQLQVLQLVNAPTLNVGTVRALLDAQVDLADLTLAMAQALTTSQPLSATLLEGLAVGIPRALRVRLGDVLRVELPDVEAAAQARINPLELLLVAAQVANAGNLLDLGAALPTNPLANITLRLRIVEPPQLAIGVEGTEARSAQIRLALDTQVLSLPASLLAVTGLHLPLHVEAAPGVATLRRIDCAADVADCAVEFDVRPGLARACVGVGPGGEPGCNGPVQLTSLKVSVWPLGDIVVAVNGFADANLSNTTAQTARIAGAAVMGSHWTGSAPSGASVADGLAGLFTSLRPQANLVVLGINIGAIVNPLLAALTGVIADVTATILRPILAGLLDPLLGLLGVQAGVADLHQIELRCAGAELVN